MPSPSTATGEVSERTALRSLGYDFALLGLPARESRVDVIRKAASRTAARIHDAAVDAHDQESMLSDLAASTYRLLDPRKRSHMLERIQLCIFSEDDLELQKQARSRLLTRGTGSGPHSAAQQREAFARECIVSEMLDSDAKRCRVGAVTLSLLGLLSLLALAAFIAS